MAGSRWDANSDLDYMDEPWRHGVERACVRCGDPIELSTTEPYVAQPVCDGCWREAQETQRQRIAQARLRTKKKGAA